MAVNDFLKIIAMPTILLIRGFRFFFWSNENEEPIHIHVEKGDAEGKIWLMPNIQVAYLHGFTKKEGKAIIKIITENILLLQRSWYDYFEQ